jgi:hypothetical protein
VIKITAARNQSEVIDKGDCLAMAKQPLIATALIAAALATVGPAVAAPPQLFNKTIQLNWSTQVVQRDEAGEISRPRIDAARTVYVSTAGRLFDRASRENQKLRLKKGGDYGPGATTTAAGEARGLRFAGNSLVGNVAFATGAVQFTATFDPSFSSCSLNVVYGKESGRARRRGLTGKMYEIESLTVTSQTCSVREGNPFAGQ